MVRKVKFNRLDANAEVIQASYAVRTLQEAQAVGSILAEVCPNRGLAAMGITELLINAIEHGNLGISYEEKTTLYKNQQWLTEVERRLGLPANHNKVVNVSIVKSTGKIRIRITDQGDGFDWQKYQNMNINNVYSTHGRGLIIARGLTFDDMIYHGAGNDVECTISCG